VNDLFKKVYVKVENMTIPIGAGAGGPQVIEKSCRKLCEKRI
jgi:hypothetical protein